MSNVSVNGIIISSMPIGEYDRRVEILTSDYGRISA
ncbi:MAG: DNA repair protein RecO, partial [Lachnospiraceae bacterium]|nr:DNA repair protein RecO [Lachnospiraceae bacterium]